MAFGPKLHLNPDSFIRQIARVAASALIQFAEHKKKIEACMSAREHMH